ncbi:MAG: CoA-binding protein [Candidatus Micrarchaeota archaeon]|nr:CoA-binding protein [Candidatus Micrarchaeota archaeon]
MTKRPRYFNLEPIMNPKSIAVIGASDNPDKIGHVILANNVASGFRGAIYPININASGTIMGYTAYKSILDVKEKVDLAVVAVPAEVVPKVVEECGRAGVRGIIVVSGGFSEVGRKDLQDKVTRSGMKYNIPIIGPNCLGVTDSYSKIDTLFLPAAKIDKPVVGGVSFASQSGAVGSSVLDMIDNEGFGLARFISYGNAAVVDEVDILNYLADDEKTKVIVFYIEGVQRGKEFIEAAKRAALKKPIVVSKGGMTDEGAKAAHSHTAALAGSHQAYEAVFKQFGFIMADDIQELLNLSKIFETQPLPKGRRIAILTNGGGTGVLATDALYEHGLQIAEMSKKTVESLRKVMPPIVNVRLPLDMAGDAEKTRFEAALAAFEADPKIDAIIAIALFQTPGADENVAAKLVEYGTKMRKPMVVVSPGGSYTKRQRQIIEKGGVPVYESPGEAAKALAALASYAEYRDSHVKKSR